MNLFLIAATGLIALITTGVCTPLIIQASIRRGFIESDDNKRGKPKVAGMGGFALLAGLMAALLAAIIAYTYIAPNLGTQNILLAALATIAMVGLVGIVDDLFRIRLFFKTMLPVVGSFPLVAVRAGQSILTLPFIGALNFGPLFNFILVPLGVTGAANAANLTAGYNGLEAGFGVIASATLLSIAINQQSTEAAILLSAGLGACIAFLLFNWFPAKIFPGDVGTLSIGSLLAAAVIVGNMEKYGIILFIPAFYELGATIYYSVRGIQRRKAVHSPLIASDGTLRPPAGSEHFTLPHLILSLKPLKEPQLVMTYLSLFVLSGLLALAAYAVGF